jgi:DNA polymerase-3 subunit alpha
LATPIHNHTYYSAYDGLSKPIQIAERCHELGFGAAAITDHDVVAGHLEFYKTLSKEGIKPLLGIETYQSPVSRFENYGVLNDKETKRKRDNFHLILLAMNEEGLHNLWALTSDAHSIPSFYYRGRVDWELLQKYNAGLIATSACGNGLLQQAVLGNPHIEDAETILQRYLSIFGDRFYIEIGTYPEMNQMDANVETTQLAKSLGVPLIYANDAHYSVPTDYELHEEIMTMQHKKKLKDLETPHFKPALYIMGEEDVRKSLFYLPQSVVDEAIENSDRVAELCDVSLPEFKQHVPTFVPEGYKSSKDMLIELVEQGFREKVVVPKLDTKLYFNRVGQELEVMFKANLIDYLLMVRDYCLWADDHGILRGPGRGSVGGSLVAYLIGITHVDPIRYDLIFERFYNAGRENSLPDIDIDFAKMGRDAIKEYVTEKYGKDYVADIGTVIRLQPKSAILDVARVQSVPMKEAQSISNIIEGAIKAGLQPTWETVEEKLGEQLAPWREKYPDVFRDARRLLETESDSKDDQIKTYGIHATGVLISDVPLGANFPLHCRTNQTTKEKKLVSQWDMRDAEKLGFMKVDLCGLRNLDTLMELDKILIEQGDDPLPDWLELQRMDLPEGMWDLLDRGATVGIFQVEEEPLVKQIAKQMKARSIDDAAVLVAMNRPGPLQSKDAQGRSSLERYMTGRKTGYVEYLNDVVEKVTANTFGIFLYQEQIINFMVQIGYTLMEADDVRAMMGKKKKEKLAAEYNRYFPRACKYMSESDANEVWEQLKNFAEYGFNKSHAVEYGLILVKTVLAKFLYPKEFLIASVRTVDKDKKARYINEAKRLKVDVMPPIFGKAKAQCSLYEDGLMLGYNDIMGVGILPADWLAENTFEGMTPDHLELLIEELKYVQPNGRKSRAIKSNQITLFHRLCMFPGEEWESMEERLATEEELFKVAISDNSAKILEEYSKDIDENCTPYALIEEPGEYTVAGIVRNITYSKTKYNKPYARVKISDDIDELEFFVWDNNLKRLSFIFRNRMAGFFRVKRPEGKDGFTLTDAAILYPKNKIQNAYTNANSF